MSEITLRVEGMTCEHCSAKVERFVMEVDGVKSVRVDLGDKRVIVEGEHLSKDAIKEACEDAGYDVIE